jgi:hypothetical protein
MLNWFRRNLVNIVVAVVVAVPICIMAHIERSERVYTPVVDYEEPIYLEIEYEITQEVTETVEPNEIVEVTTPGDTVSIEDIDLLAHLIYAEAGSSWIKDETLYYVGSVVLNRVNSDQFPNTLYDVIYQTEPCIQYACIVDGNIEKEPTPRCYEVAEDLLKNGSVLPENVLYQASFKQGSGVYSYQDTLYFCYQ